MAATDSIFVDRSIAVLRAHHDRLAKTVAELTPEQLQGPSAASEWPRAQVLSHLGSGAEIFYPLYAAGISGEAAAEPDNQAVWDRWNSSSPQEQADGFLEHDERLVALLEGTSAEQRSTVRIDLGFMPEPVPLSLALGMRLNEVAAHAWDFLAGLDHTTELDAEAADLLLEQYVGEGAYMLGFIGKPDQLSEPAAVGLGDYVLTIGEAISLTTSGSQEPTANLQGPPEAALRLILGRLKPGFTADDIGVTGNVTLDDLRRVFPGY